MKVSFTHPGNVHEPYALAAWNGNHRRHRVVGRPTCDVTDEEAVASLAEKAGPVDILVNSAGVVGPNKPLVDTIAEEWRHTFDINVVGTVNLMKAFTPGMVERGWGRIVNFAAI